MGILASPRSVARLCLVLACSVVAIGEGQPDSIRGFVVDEQGRPSARAQVTWIDTTLPPNTVQVQAGAVPTVTSDAEGRFTIPGLEVGHRYKVYASKEDDAYPDMTVAFYNPKDEAVIAEATQDGTSAIDVHLGPKAGRLEWDVKDANTGQGVSPSFLFRPADATGGGVEGTALPQWNLLMPSNTDIVVEISASGYDTWYYPGSSIKSAAVPLRMKPGEVRTLEVRLQRKDE